MSECFTSQVMCGTLPTDGSKGLVEAAGKARYKRKRVASAGGRWPIWRSRTGGRLRAWFGP